MQDSRAAELDVVAARAADAIARGERVDAAVPAFLLRRYLAADGAAWQEALGVALAQALVLAADEPSVIGRAAWLTLLVDASRVTDDERIVPAARTLIAALRAGWPAYRRIDEAAASADACLRAAALDDRGQLVQDAIDHLERVIGSSYRPGDGLVRDEGGIRRRASHDDHVRAASALLTAFEVTGRLPYSMLAEELIAVARRTIDPDGAFVGHCEAASVLCRIAALHDDPEYRRVAVIAGAADYRADAARILADQSPLSQATTPSAAAAYGLALFDLLK